MLELFRVIGSDRCLTRSELTPAAQAHPLTDTAWEVYTTHFRGFTGSTLDPQFHRLTHPATHLADIRLGPDQTVVVVGTGPSLARQIETLTKLRRQLHIFTSPRGAETLLGYGITPDLVLIEHQTALDAHHSARHLGDAGAGVLAACPLVAADWRTPRALLAGVTPSALFVPGALSTWGLWPATAVAMAAEAGASRLALLGVDLGTAAHPDPEHAPLHALLELLASLVKTATVDCGAGGAAKKGWAQTTLDDVAGARLCTAIETERRPAPRPGERAHDASVALARVAPVIERAARLRSLALQARSHLHGVPAPSLRDGIDAVLAWGLDPQIRIVLQESLGVSFLPRFWRTGVDPSLGHALWRPLLLATHELTAQAEALAQAVAAERAA